MLVCAKPCIGGWGFQGEPVLMFLTLKGMLTVRTGLVRGRGIKHKALSKMTGQD